MHSYLKEVSSKTIRALCTHEPPSAAQSIDIARFGLGFEDAPADTSDDEIATHKYSLEKNQFNDNSSDM